MSDSENESRAAAVGRKRIRTGESGNYAIAAPASSAASDSESGSSSKESGEISSSERGSRDSSRQQNISADSESDQGSESDDDSSDTDGSSETDDSDEEPPAHSLASPQGQAGQHHSSRANRPKDRSDEELRLSDLTEKEEDDQLFYFHRHRYGEKHPKDYVVRCFCCGAKGHVHATCPERKCKDCGAYDAHASHACPQGRKCGRCRQRGHDSPECTNTTKPPNTIADACDICGEMGHVEEECMKLWCTGPEPVTMRAVRRMWKACYNCGAEGYDDADGHWGDDCPYLDRYARDGLGQQIKTWSAAHASQFIDPEVEDSDVEESEDDDSRSEESRSNDSRYDPMEDLEDYANDTAGSKRVKEKAGESEGEEGEVEESTPPPPPPARSNWQMSLFDDARD